jgi:two-component system, cell cycle sensor histidine kinase and response regulator CckA
MPFPADLTRTINPLRRKPDLDALISAFDGFIFIGSQDYHILYMNDKLQERTGYDATGEYCYKVLHGCEEICPWCTNDRLFHEQKIIRSQVKSPKDEHWYDIINTPIHNNDGTISCQFLIMDINDSKKQERELIEERSKIESLLAALTIGVTLQDTDFKVLYQNKAHIDKQGVHTGEYCYQAYQHRTTVCDGCLLDQSFADGKIHRRETTAPGKDGVIHLEVISSPIKDEEGNIIAGIESVRDITAQKNLEEQLRQFQKIESVGHLAGGVAHEFNNMLGVILGYAELAMDKVDPAQPLYVDLKEIRRAAERSADITRQLLAFARKQMITPKVIDLNETIETLLKMLRRLIGENIDLLWVPASGLWSVKADPSQIEQILTNLCVNAREAIEDVGRITVETANSTLDDIYCETHAGCISGEYVRISVRDTGCGMDKQTMAHIFEPFFSTKDVGQGTGLGLSMVYGAVKQNKGYVDFASEPGQGTVFTIYLPRYVVAGTTGWESGERAEAPAEVGRETILLVEDEPTILKMITTMLQRLGYFVLAASTPSEAIRLVEGAVAEIHLLLTDVIMPEMNGRDLAERLVPIKKGMKCLFMSGYTSDIIANQGILVEGIPFIQKPFSQKELTDRIRKVLNHDKEKEN